MQSETQLLVSGVLVIPAQDDDTAALKCTEVKIPLSKERLVTCEIISCNLIDHDPYIPDLRGLIHRCLVEKQLSCLLDRTKWSQSFNTHRTVRTCNKP